MSKRDRRARKKANRQSKQEQVTLQFEPAGDILVRCLGCGLIQPQHGGDCRACGHPYAEYAAAMDAAVTSAVKASTTNARR